MTIKPVALAIGAVVGFLHVSAFAGGELADPAVGGDWNAAATWLGGARPVAGEAVVVKPTADAKVTMSADDSTDYKSLTFYSSSVINQAASIEFDGNGKTLLMPTSADGNYDTKPFVFLDGAGKNLLYVDDGSLSAEDKRKAAPVRLTDAHFKLSQTADGASTFVLDRGKMDFYTDAGDAAANRTVYMAHGNAKTFCVAVTNATIEVPKFNSAWNGYEISYSFDRATFISHGLAKLAVDNSHYHCDCDLVAKDSTFDFQGGVYFGRGEYKTFENCTITGGSIDPAWTHATLFKNCTMNLTGCMDVGGQGAANSWESVFNLTFDGGTYAYGESAVGGQGGDYLAQMTITGGATVDFLKDYKTTLPWGQCIGGRGTGVVDVVSGLFRTPACTYRSLYVGHYSDAYGTGTGRLYVRGGKVQVRIGAESWASAATDGLAVGGGGKGEVYVSGGEVVVPRVSVGFNEAKHSLTSFVYQTGGKIDVSVIKDPNYSCFGLSFYSGCGGAAFNDRDAKHPAAYYFDGGVLEAGRLWGGKGSKCQGGTGYSLLSADGGTYRLNMSRGSWTNIYGLDRCEVGAKGLTIDSNGYEVKVEQDICDKAGSGGRVVKTGLGTLLYSGSLTASDLVVSGGVWQVVSGTTTSRLAMSPGAEFSTAGDVTGVTLSGLAITNATLRIDPGDTITVNGPATFDGLTLTFTSAPTKDEAQTVFVINGTLDPDSASALRRTCSGIQLADGTHLAMEVVTVGGVTTVTATVKDDAAPIGPEGTIAWTGSGNWSTAANWTPATVPTAANKAAFTSVSAGKVVTVDANAVVGALSFGDDGYVLSGDSAIEIAGEQGAAQIETLAGSNAVETAMIFDTVVSVPVAEGACLDLSGDISYGGINKAGAGRLVLSGANSFVQETTFKTGITVVASDEALGTVQTTIPSRLRGGTMRFEGDEPRELVNSLKLDAAPNVVMDAATDTTLKMDVTGGAAIFKRGTGTLTLPVADAKTVWTTRAKTAVPAYSESLAYGEDGSVTASYPASINVSEGAMVIASSDGERKALSLSGSVVVGTVGTAVQSAPELTIEKVDLTLPVETSLHIGQDQGTKWPAGTISPKLTILDASVSTHNFSLGERCVGGATALLAMTNATLVGRYALYLGGGAYGAESNMIRAKDSTLRFGAGGGGNFSIYGKVDFDFENCMLDRSDDDYAYLDFRYNYGGLWPSGKVVCRNGTLLKVSSVKMNGVYQEKPILCKPFELAFDDATWDYGSADISITSTVNSHSNFTIRVTGGGLKLPTPSGTTFHTDSKVVGDGGIVKSGEGTLSFGPGAYQFTGPLCALAGTVDLSNAGTITNGCFGAGEGTITGATLKDPVFRLDAGAPTLTSCTFAGRGYLDVGDEPLTKPYPTNQTVLKFTGTEPNVSNWRLRGTGRKGLGATFAVEGNEVKVTIEERGFLLLVR